MMRRFALPLSALSLVIACGGADTGEAVSNQTGLPFAEGSNEAVAVLAVANDTSLGVEEFDSAEYVGLDGRAARNIVEHRDGPDPTTTEDDNPFDLLAELYGVSYCKNDCVNSLLEYAKRTGVYQDGSSGNAYVIFSPQAMENSHLTEAAKFIDGAQHTVDIAMYSYSHQDPVRSALRRALERGVKIRFLANTDLANSESKAGGLEELGIDVRRVTKIMHHKFAIIDGPRDESSHGRAATARIVSGSGNWSSSAATKYDENTLFLNGYPELALRMQRDFDTLWAGSKDIVYNESLEWDTTSANISDELIAQYEDPNSHAYFTSVNFSPTSSKGWSVLGTTAVTDQLVAAIGSADTSIEIATGHFLSIPIASAVANALQSNPALDVKIVLDCQETSKSGEIADLKEDIEDAGGSIYYKCNTYRWHYKYANQMHHKYIVLDGDELYTGSLNFSDNAETNTFENILMFTGAEHASLVQSYRANFETVRAYGRENNLATLDELRDDIANGSTVPLTWNPPMSIDLGTFRDLKDLIREHCPATKSWTSVEGAQTYNQWFNQYPQWFTTCQKDGYPWPQVPYDMRVD